MELINKPEKSRVSQFLKKSLLGADGRRRHVLNPKKNKRIRIAFKIVKTKLLVK